MVLDISNILSIFIGAIQSYEVIGGLLLLLLVFFIVRTTPSKMYKGPALGSGKMFDIIARRYDFINRVMAIGMDQGWRRAMVRALNIQPQDQCLDLATGTADVAMEMGRAILSPSDTQTSKGHVLGVDPSVKMLEVGRRKVQRAGMSTVVTLEEGDGQQLDLEDDRFDKVSIAFGIRNIPDRPRALREMRRVIKANARSRLAILEFTDPEGHLLAPLARAFVRFGVPRIGALLSGRVDEYMHLHHSIVKFPQPAEFERMIEEAGFKCIRQQQFCFGTVCLFLAEPVTIRTSH
mmetsp:Transcript_97486/g.168127  ORF Transcript_97486/g.168127 Transcript_97486/m.168127 type:complete len:292 (-) Transcript_97486:537-1412(-)